MSFYDAAVPAYLQMLNSLTGLLTKAEAHCAARKIDPSVLLGSRLFPDMLPLSKQIQRAFDALQKLLDEHKTGQDEFVSYDKVTEAQRKELSDAVNALAEPLSKMTGAITL